MAGIPASASPVQYIVHSFCLTISQQKEADCLTRGLSLWGSPNHVQVTDVLGNKGISGLWQQAHVIWNQETWLAIPLCDALGKSLTSLNFGFPL